MCIRDSPAEIEFDDYNYYPTELHCKVIDKCGRLPGGYKIWDVTKEQRKGSIDCMPYLIIHSLT